MVFVDIYKYRILSFKKDSLWNLENKGLEPKYCFSICFYETKSQLVQPVSVWKLEVETEKKRRKIEVDKDLEHCSGLSSLHT